MADASILSSYADGILLVVRNDMVASRRIKRAVENLENSGTKLVGCIYNDTESGMPKRFMSSYNKSTATVTDMVTATAAIKINKFVYGGSLRRISAF